MPGTGKGFGRGSRFKFPSAGSLCGPMFVMFNGRVAPNAPNTGRTEDVRNMLSFDFGAGWASENDLSCIGRTHSLASWTGIRLKGCSVGRTAPFLLPQRHVSASRTKRPHFHGGYLPGLDFEHRREKSLRGLHGRAIVTGCRFPEPSCCFRSLASYTVCLNISVDPLS